jgi:hypothetical protein
MEMNALHPTNENTYARIKYLINHTQLLDTNCFQAVLYAANLTNSFRLFGDVEFLQKIRTNCIPVRNPKFGDIICLEYNGGKNCQHAFMCIDDYRVFEKTGPGKSYKYRITKLFEAVASYDCKRAYHLQKSNDLSTTSFITNLKLAKCYRVNKKARLGHPNNCGIL